MGVARGSLLGFNDTTSELQRSSGVLPLAPARAAKVFDDIDLMAEREVSIFITKPFARLTAIHGSSDPARHDADGTVRTPSRRLIYESGGVLDDRDLISGLRNALAVKTEIRVSITSLPFKLIIADGSRALMTRLPPEEGDPRTFQYVVDRTLIRALTLVFEQAWTSRQTLAYDPNRGIYDDRMPVLGQRELRVYRELMTGATLESIAHNVAVSKSTVQRTLRFLYALAGVEDRAQFVAFATKHWN
ncbi:helix-turn-helix transcriptional regulator [Nonomuraea dietziae]|uniref:helix-turn-helix transcriptional regulator n=1 Tax=Nonomuraea dietziae TaxID=65515 RepID=UPI003413970D